VMAEDPGDEVDIYRTITRRDNWGGGLHIHIFVWAVAHSYIASSYCTGHIGYSQKI
jgi:hypothetical protein